MNNIKNPLVSVIVLTLNSEHYISRCLLSLQKQLKKNFEVILVDAGSNDKTFRIVKSFMKRLTIRVIHAPATNMGQARNIGISNSKGEYICFCDSDDYYLPAKLANQLFLLQQNNKFDAVYYDPYHFKTGSSSLFSKKRYLNKSGFLFGDLLKKQFININSLLLKKIGPHGNVVKFPNHEDGKYSEDWQYLLQLCLNGYFFYYSELQLSVIEERSNSHTSEKIQYLMKYHIFKFLTANKKIILSKSYVSSFRLNYYLTMHKLKFILACLLCDELDYALDKLRIRKSTLIHFLLWFLYFTFLKQKRFKSLVRFFINFKNNFFVYWYLILNNLAKINFRS